MSFQVQGRTVSSSVSKFVDPPQSLAAPHPCGLALQTAPAASSGLPAEHAHCVEDDGDIDDFLDQGALEGRQVSEGRSHHAEDGQGDAGEYALQGDSAGPLGDTDPVRQTVDAVDEEDNVGSLRGCGGTARATSGLPMPVPLLSKSVRADFPTPADDFG